jgi:hypothetical protein
MSGCGSTDFTRVSRKYPVYSLVQAQAHPITSALIVTDKRQDDKSLDHLVKVPVVEQVRQLVTEELQSTGRFVVTDGSAAKYSLLVEIEQLHCQIPGYATRSVTNMLLSEATMGLSNFVTLGSGINVVGHVQLRAVLSESGDRVVWDITVSGEHKESASMQTAKAHAVEGSVMSFALQEALAKLKARVIQSSNGIQS